MIGFPLHFSSEIEPCNLGGSEIMGEELLKAATWIGIFMVGSYLGLRLFNRFPGSDSTGGN